MSPTFQTFALLLGFFFLGICVMTIWHRVWFGSGAGRIGRLLARCWENKGQEPAKARESANRTLRIVTSLLMLLIAVICFVLIQILVVW
jgi:hypothetical protein